MNRQIGDHGPGDGSEPTAGWPDAFSPFSSPVATASGSRPHAISRNHPPSSRGDRHESSRADSAPAPHPVRRAALRGHVALRHLPPRDPEQPPDL
jgi:hypothetical protein